MLTFDEIEDCFPAFGGTTDDGCMIASAQWLRDFATAVAAKEREACAKACEALQVNKSPDYYPGVAFDGACRTCAGEIRKRANVGIEPPKVGSNDGLGPL